MSESPEWSYDTAPDLDKSILQRLEGYPREPDLVVYGLRSMSALLIRGWMRLYHRMHVEGAEHIPAGACVIVANHQSHLDVAAVQHTLPLRRLHRAFPAAAKDYFFESVPRLAFATICVNALPFARDAAGTTTLRTCRALIQTPGNVLILFPEGTRSRDGVMGPFLPGVGSIVACSDVPVVPCRIRGAQRAWQKGTRLPRPRAVSATFGAPLTFGDRPRGKHSAQAIADELRGAVEAL